MELNYSILEINYLIGTNLNLLSSVFKNQEIDILSDEIEVLTEKLFSHRMLFSTQKDIDIQFEDIEIKIKNADSRNYKKLCCQFKVV